MKPCDICDARCCREPAVFLTAFDVKKISKETGKKPLEFVEASECRPDIEFPSFKLGAKECCLVMKKDPAGGCCVFLKGSPKGKQCAVYNARPRVCRAHPFTLNNNKLEYVKGMACPNKWNLDAKSKEAMVKEINELRAEQMMYFNMTKNWNKGVSIDFSQFLDYLMECL